MDYINLKIKEATLNDIDNGLLKVYIEEYRHKGLSKQLMEKAKSIAKDNNCGRIELNCWMFNENALSMYEHIVYDK